MGTSWQQWSKMQSLVKNQYLVSQKSVLSRNHITPQPCSSAASDSPAPALLHLSAADTNISEQHTVAGPSFNTWERELNCPGLGQGSTPV